MIFKRLFSPSHSSNKPEVRKSAIEKLSADKPQDKSILHELAFNDSDPQVTLAALNKLNSFALWQKAAQSAHHEQVQRTARQYIENAVLTDSHSSLSEQQRSDYLIETATTELAKSALLKPVTGLSDEVILTLLDKVNRDEFTLSYYQQSAAPSVRRRIIEQTNDAQLLEKLSRKESDQALLETISHKLAHFAEAKKMPDVVSRQVTLILAKLKALLERTSYEDVLERRSALISEFEQLEEQLHWLDDEQQHDAKTKYQQLCEQSERHLARLKPYYEAARSQAMRSALLNTARQTMAYVKQQIDDLYANNPAKATLEQIEQSHIAMQQADTALSALNQNAEADDSLSKEVADLTKEMAVQREYLEQFSSQQQYCQQLEDILKHALNDKEKFESDFTAFSELKQQWQQTASQVFILPKEYQRQWRSLSQDMNQQRKVAEKQRDEAIKSCRRQLNIIDNMIEQGKYRSAMSRFNQLNKEFQSLDEDQQKKLSRRYQSTQIQVERLEGWQSYLAAPRKPELLDQAQQLASEKPDNIAQRAKEIKSLRQQWQSLTSPNNDSQQDEKFDAALEAAFAPCREFYAEQEVQRKAAYQERQKLIEKVESLDCDQPVEQLQQQVEALKQQWRNTGQVDKRDYEKLKQRWDAALNTPAEKINHWHHQNRERKQELIAHARELLEEGINESAASRARALQQQWKTVGHAGRRHESKLWKTFKSINDSLFQQLKQSSDEQQSAQKNEADRLIEQIDNLRQRLNIESLTEVRVSAAVVQIELQHLQGNESKRVYKALSDLQKAVGHIEQLRQRQVVAQEYSALLEALSMYTHAESPASEQIDDQIWQALARAHQQALLAKTPDKPRRWYTTKLEILANTATPDEDTSLRQNIQLAMMMAKLEQGDESELEDIVLLWVSCGAITDIEKPLFERFADVIKRLFIYTESTNERAD
ncbi:DUF349 domain-containing protein [Alteromonas lipotrueiana]|uniref:DUF349 domain-containing protein n=1 Tax=Alteromonas lipotrueiana TaxID=2803815 RepID=UPI001C4541D3|nr:DUF349 domain-containing protein [Alteromonas lipotrueiana]